MTKGYKVLKPDWTCRGFQYEVGKDYKLEGTLEICNYGLHFCEKVADCFDYYKFDSSNKIAEVEALGEIVTDGDKSATNHIRIVREISWQEMLELANEGKGNTGLRNTGHSNTGDSNTGYRNTGYWNKCDRSSGFFCNETPKPHFFNKPTDLTDLTWEEANKIGIYGIMQDFKMSSGEGYKEHNQQLWGELSEGRKSRILNLPNFDAIVFEDITGVRV